MSNSFQHVLYRNVIITAAAAVFVKEFLLYNCLVTYLFCWWLTPGEQNESCRCHRLIHLYGLNGSPLGWIHMSNELLEMFATNFACVVGKNTGLWRGFVDVSPACWKKSHIPAQGYPTTTSSSVDVL